MRLAALLLPIALLAGCAAPAGLAPAGDAGERDPFYKEWRSFVDGSHLMLYEVPVEEGASLANVTLLLDPRTNGLPAPDVALAQLTLTLTDGTGAAVGEGEVDMQRRVATLVVEDPAPGIYLAQVSGVGASREVDGERYGAAYVMTAEVLYGG